MENETNKEMSLIDTLTPQQLAFFVHLKRGNSVIEAYKKAGYEGNDHAAYQLKSRLNQQFSQFMQETSMHEADWLKRVNELLEKPVVRYDQFGKVYDVPGLTMDQYIKLLAIEQKRLEAKKNVSKPQITAFQINRFTDNKKETTTIEVNGNTVGMTEEETKKPEA